MHLKKIRIRPEKFPTRDHYPFNMALLQQTREVVFSSPITFFVGENGTGKSTLLKAVARKCGIHIWKGVDRARYENNPYEESLHRVIDPEWSNGHVTGSFFGSETFRDFTRLLDEWAADDHGILDYFGGESLVTQSHGQSILSYFRARYTIKGLYLLDEPETALSPRSQLALLKILATMGNGRHAQFIIATHSPILMACPGSAILSFDFIPPEKVDYKETEHYVLYRDFLNHTSRFFDTELTF